jgi:BlaI family transcriptional regulator, penicillinase repressor
MRRERPSPGGSLEYAALVAVCEAVSITGRELHDRIGTPRGLAYTTTARVLDRLFAKGLVLRELVRGAFLYRAAVSRREIDRARLTKTLSGVLGDGPRPAMATLVDVIEEIDPGLLEELIRTVNARRSRREP